MRLQTLLFRASSLLILCINTLVATEAENTWAKAQWIAFEQLEAAQQNLSEKDYQQKAIGQVLCLVHPGASIEHGNVKKV